MSINTADIHAAIRTAWVNESLNNPFRALWDEGALDPDPLEFPVLQDQEAGGDQPFPYCVLEVSSSTTTDRMSGDEIANREIRDVSVIFQVHARLIGNDPRTAKEIAADLAEEVMKVFGGHPTQSPTDLVLANGNFLISQFQNDFGIRTGDDEYLWRVEYLIRVDVPVAV